MGTSGGEERDASDLRLSRSNARAGAVGFAFDSAHVELRVAAERYHARQLRTPREVRHALAYTLGNARKHGVRVEGIDPCSSGAAFDGWRDRGATLLAALAVHALPPVAAARSWLLRVGWRRHGLIGVAEVPGPAP